MLTEMSDWPMPKTIYEDDYVVLDQKQVPQNIIESIEQKTIRMNRRIRKKFTTQKDFDDAFKKEVKPDKHGNISVDQLKDFILHECEDDIMNRRVTKRDIEGFLSAFNYNMYGSTNQSDATNLIFTQDNEIQKKLACRVRPNAPPEELEGGIKPKDIDVKDVHN